MGEPPTPAVTLIAGRYRRERLLGRGGMGEVHAAVDLQTGRPVAVKRMLGHRLDNADARARFEREARVGARLASPALVEVLDAGVAEDDGTPFIVMELLVGEDLEHRLARLGPRPAQEVVDHLGEVARALTQLEAARIVHRDLKPSNLFRHQPDDRPAQIKVLDLGIAKELTDTEGRSTGIAGTPTYMAPEQITGAAMSAATDRHALGLIAFTLLAGAPYWRKAADEEPIALALRMKDGPVLAATRRAQELGVEVPAAFDAWFHRATARRPSQRFRSAVAEVRALARALGVAQPAALADAPDPDEPDEPDEPDAPDDLEGPDAPDDPEGADAPDHLARQARAAPTSDDGWVAAGDGSPTMTAPPRPRRTATPTRSPAPPGSDADAPRRRWRGPAALGALGAGALVAWAAWPGPAVGVAPLAAADAVLACPILAVDGDGRDDGWLGAAAASLACERGRVVLGGAASRTLLPAELLDLPTVPGDAFPIDPYGAADARSRSVATARRRGAAFLDGAVHRRGAQLEVELALRRPDGSAIAYGTGVATALAAAVQAAMQPLLDAGALPTARAVDPIVADYGGAADVETLLDYLDLALAFRNNGGQLDQACEDFVRRHPGGADLVQFAAWDCAYTAGAALPQVTLTGTPITPGAQAIRARIRHLVLRDTTPDVAADLAALLDEATSPWARSALASTLSCLVQADPGRATMLALQAIQHEPKNPTGELCAPWEQLLAVDAQRPSVAAAMQAWEPWQPYGWLYDPDAARGLDHGRRAYLLSPSDATVATTYAGRLIAAGRLEDARAIAVALEAGGAAAQILEGERVLLQIASSKAAFGEALARAVKLAQPQAADAGWVHTQRLALGADAVALAVVLGRAREVADRVVDGHLAGLRVEGVDNDQTEWWPTICAYASPAPARACFAALAELTRARAATTRASTAAYVEGARRYAEGDLSAAATAWRPLVATRGYGRLAEAMVVAFAAIGADDIVDDIAAAGGTDYNGASMVMARAALVLAGRGDQAAARALAARVVTSWGKADVEPPILVQLRDLAR